MTEDPTIIYPWVVAASQSSLDASWCRGGQGAVYFYSEGHFWFCALDSTVPILMRDPILDGTAKTVEWLALEEGPLLEFWEKREPIHKEGSLEQACEASDCKCAYRYKSNKLLMFYEPPTVWTQQSDGRLRQISKAMVRNISDWKPLFVGSEEAKVLEDKFGPTVEVPKKEWQGWTSAIGASPVNIAMRRDKEGKLWVRRSKDSTWMHSIATDAMVPVRGGFRHYDGWEPMPADHPLARANWLKGHIPYRDPAFLPTWLKPEETEEWLATGSCPHLREHQRKHAEKVEAHNARIEARKPPAPASTIQVPKANDNDNHVYVDLPAPEVLSNLVPLVTALSSTVEKMVEIGDKDTASAIAKQVGYLVGGASWHLRANRTEYARRRNK